MEPKDPAVNTTTPAAAPKVEVTTTTEDDVEARIAVLEAEKAKAIEEAANWKVAALKNKGKKSEDLDLDESEEERVNRIVQENFAKNKIVQIDTEKEMLLKRLAKENKELKLAQLNKTSAPPAGTGTHSEGPTVQSTSITPEQLAAFKARGWSDKDIERYKKNLAKYSGR